jgi:hypothetical protein
MHLDKKTHAILATAAERFRNAFRSGFPQSVTLTFSEPTARVIEAAITSIVGNDNERVDPIDACKNWAGTCNETCGACRDDREKATIKRQQKVEAATEKLDVIREREEDGTVVELLVPAGEVALPWICKPHGFPGLGFSIRDAYGRQRALVPNEAIAEAIIKAVTAQAAVVVCVPKPEWLELQRGAEIPHPPTELTYHCRQAIAGEGPRAYDWSDKPHRLIFDLCREIERREAIARAAK